MKIQKVIFVFIFASLVINLYSQKVIGGGSYDYVGTLSYKDGKPFDLYGAGLEDFSVTLIRTPKLYAGHVFGFKNDTISLKCAVTGKYKLEFMDMEIATFEVSKQGGEFISNLPEKLSLPFNIFIVTEPNHTIKIYMMMLLLSKV
jgi:hypothetical protein